MNLSFLLISKLFAFIYFYLLCAQFFNYAPVGDYLVRKLNLIMLFVTMPVAI